MRSLISGLCLWLAPCAFGATFSYQVAGGNPGSWPAILSSIGLVPGALTPGDRGVVVALDGSAPAGWAARVEAGTVLILEGDSPLAASFGFRPGQGRVSIRSVEDLHAPKLRIVWEQALDLPAFEVPKDARVFMRERLEAAPLMAGVRRGKGAVLWVAAPPGLHGYERFPYLPQALVDLGLTPPFRSSGLWAFFDSSYRARVDLDYFAAKWRAAGISALHVAAWHFWERDPENDAYLRHLIEACHRNAILVYAWLELPHVSEKFWDQHPDWREKTALGQDAQLDWRKLMNLSHPQTFEVVAGGLRELMDGFDWDGLNLAELYFESLEGFENPARLTPLNEDVRAEFQKRFGFDPKDLFDTTSPRQLSENTAGLKRFLDFRAELAQRQQSEWIAQAEQIRKTKPYLDLTLTHVDDRFDTTMREKIGADVTAVLPLLADHDFTFLIEDPATIWNLGPQRYPQIAARYRPLTSRQDKLAIDINVVERYQDVYPTKQATGSELFQLVHQAAIAFPKVALYFESSLSPVDLPLLSCAAASVEKAEQSGAKTVIQSRGGTGVVFDGPTLVDGKPWPIASDTMVWLPGGTHSVESGPKTAGLRVTAFNGELKSASATTTGVQLAYRSSARALATVDPLPRRVEIDGAEIQPRIVGNVVFLPRGQHLVTLTAP